MRVHKYPPFWICNIYSTQGSLLADSGLSYVNLVIGLLSVCFRPEADTQHNTNTVLITLGRSSMASRPTKLSLACIHANQLAIFT